MSARNVPKPPPAGTDPQENFEPYTRKLGDLIVGRSDQEELHAASAQLSSYAADLRRLVQDGQRGIASIEQCCVELLESLLCATLRRDEAALRHANATERYAMLFAHELGLSEAEEARVGRAARLHDVGKIVLSEALLTKATKLDAGEQAMLGEHCVPGVALAKATASRELQLIGDAIQCHHENWDGSGYPRGLAHEDIPLVARIVRLVDVYDTLRDARCYKPGLPHAEACRIILEGDDRTKPLHFDPRLLERFTALAPRLESLSGGGPSGA